MGIEGSAATGTEEHEEERGRGAGATIGAERSGRGGDGLRAAG